MKEELQNALKHIYVCEKGQKIMYDVQPGWMIFCTGDGNIYKELDELLQTIEKWYENRLQKWSWKGYPFPCSSGSILILVFTLTKLLSWCLPDTGEVIQTVCCGELVSSKDHYVTCNAKSCLTQTPFSQKIKYIQTREMTLRQPKWERSNRW